MLKELKESMRIMPHQIEKQKLYTKDREKNLSYENKNYGIKTTIM